MTANGVVTHKLNLCLDLVVVDCKETKQIKVLVLMFACHMLIQQLGELNWDSSDVGCGLKRNLTLRLRICKNINLI